MRVIDINGRLATAGSWDETSQSEADAQARLRATRTGLRAMLAGNEAFHVDPMAAPAAVSFTPSVIGLDVAGGPGRSATVTYTRTGSTVRIDTVFTTPAPQLATTLPTEPEAEVWHTEAPTVAGVYIASSDRNPDFRRHWDGLVWSYAWREGDPEEVIAISRSLRHQAKTHIQWLRLIEADTPAPAAQERAKPRVERIQPSGVIIGGWRIDGRAYKAIDKDGWIPHWPTADAVCPVPDGVEFETRRRNGRVIGMDRLECLWQTRTDVGHAAEPTAWRPIQA